VDSTLSAAEADSLGRRIFRSVGRYKYPRKINVTTTEAIQLEKAMVGGGERVGLETTPRIFLDIGKKIYRLPDSHAPFWGCAVSKSLW